MEEKCAWASVGFLTAVVVAVTLYAFASKYLDDDTIREVAELNATAIAIGILAGAITRRKF